MNTTLFFVAMGLAGIALAILYAISLRTAYQNGRRDAYREIAEKVATNPNYEASVKLDGLHYAIRREQSNDF